MTPGDVMSGLVATRSVVSALACISIAGCSLTTDPRRQQCVKDEDCGAHASELGESTCVNSWCEPEPAWSCLAQSIQANAEAGRFEATLRAEDMVTQQPLSGVTARLCRKLDVSCDDARRGEAVTDGKGKVQFEVDVEGGDRGFTGYVQFTRNDLMPGLYFFNPPITSSVDVPQVQLLTPMVAQLLAMQAGISFMSERGLILLRAFDCTDEPVPGVVFEVDDADPNSTAFYSVDGLPSRKATATDTSGYGGVINAAPGTITVKARLAGSRRVISTVSILVKAGAITYSRMVPGGS